VDAEKIEKATRIWRSSFRESCDLSKKFEGHCMRGNQEGNELKAC
jgi:hypothetical protein